MRARQDWRKKDIRSYLSAIARQARLLWHAGQAINEVWRSILLNKYSRKMAFT
ncbi:MAG: hypothetical protein HKN76_21950, partial [Saprospiraceae bacterium]|nr:hypothetical protein [Saprospiraceae bacterium]